MIHMPYAQQEGGGPPPGQPQFTGRYTAVPKPPPYGGQPSYQQPQQPQGTQQNDSALLELSSSTEFCKPTMGRVPQSASTRQKTLNLPVGLFVRPLAPSAVEVPVVSFGSTKVVRCHNCRTYINPFVTWESAGHRWVCNICRYPNETPASYLAPLDERGHRVDLAERVELRCGAVEFIAPGDYMVRPPQPPSFMFVIDVSYHSVASGLLLCACQAIRHALMKGEVPGGDRTLVGFVTFDSSVHFYKLDCEGQPHMMVVPSLDDVFTPLPDGALTNFHDNQANILALLEALPSLWAQQKVSSSCAGSAVKAAHQAMKKYGGKMSVFLSSAATVGDLIQPQPKANRSEVEALKPLDGQLRDVAATLTQAQISVDVYLAPAPTSQTGATGAPKCQAPDVPTWSLLAQFSGGEIRYYADFTSASQGDPLRADIVKAMTQVTAWEAVMRLRVCHGWTITQWYGHFLFRHNDLLVLPNCNEDQAIAVQLELRDKVVQSPYLYLQAALLYTNSDGERRIRVHTVCLPTSQNANECLAAVDDSTTTALIVQQCLAHAQTANLVEARQALQAQLTQYQSGLHQFQSGLAAAVHAFLKSDAMREGRDVSPAARVALWRRLATMPPESIVALCAQPPQQPQYQNQQGGYQQPYPSYQPTLPYAQPAFQPPLVYQPPYQPPYQPAYQQPAQPYQQQQPAPPYQQPYGTPGYPQAPQQQQQRYAYPT